MQFLNPILPLAATDHFWPWDKDLVAVVYLKNDAKLDKWERDRRKSSKRCITEQIIPGWLKLIPLITQADPVDDSERLCRRHLVIVLLKARELAYLSTSSHPPLAGTCPAQGGGVDFPVFLACPACRHRRLLPSETQGLEEEVTSMKLVPQSCMWPPGQGHWQCLPQVQDFCLSYLKALSLVALSE